MNPLVPLLPYIVSIFLGASSDRWNKAAKATGILVAIVILLRIVTGRDNYEFEMNGIAGVIGFETVTALVCFLFAAMGYGARRLFVRPTPAPSPPPPLPSEPAERGTGVGA